MSLTTEVTIAAAVDVVCRSAPTTSSEVKLVPEPVTVEPDTLIVPVRFVKPVVLLPSPASYQYGTR